MKTKSIFIVALTLVFFVSLSADAGRKRRKKKKNEEIPHSAAIAEQMEGLSWGMSNDDVFSAKKKTIQEEYKDKFKQVRGAIEEDNIRTKMLSEIRKVKSSYVEFEGQNTGWEVSMIGSEFEHDNGEALMMSKGDRYDDYLFFYRSKLWKRFRAFKRDAFKGLTFKEFIDVLEKRFGEGKHIKKTNEYGEEVLVKVEWQDDTTLLRAIDNSPFYGVFCMVFYDKAVYSKLGDRVKKKVRTKGDDYEDPDLIEAITSGTAEDDASNIVEQLTGKKRGKKAGIDIGHSVTKRNVDEKKKKEEEEEDEDDDLDDIL